MSTAPTMTITEQPTCGPQAHSAATTQSRLPEVSQPVRVAKLIYQSYLPFQGRYPRVSGQARILQENGYDVTVLACDRDGEHPTDEVLDGIRVKRIPVRTGENRGPFRQLWPLLLFTWRAFNWLRKQKFDIIHCHNIDILPLGCLVGRVTGAPVIFEAHEPDYYALWPKRWQPVLRLVNAAERFFARRCSGISVTNQYQVDKYRQMGIRHVELIGNYPLTHLRIDRLPEEKFTRKGFVFGRLGTVYKETGFEVAIAAFREVIKDHPDAEFLIAGRVADNYREDFERLTEPVKDHLRLTGAFAAEEMPRLYNEIDVSLFVYPRSDWFRNITPRKFFDSLANGVPVIMTDIGGLGPVIREQMCGVVVPDTDVEAVVLAMKHLIIDVPLRRELAENSLRLSQSQFSWNHMAERYLSLQQTLLAETRKS
jgi:glycosyltransferase involved in cell wall biosynthesis